MVVLIGSLVLLVGAPLAWVGFVASSDSKAVASVGERPTGAATTQSAPTRPAPSPSSTAPQVAGDDVPRIGRTLQPRSVKEAIVPVSIGIDRLNVQASIDAVGVVEDGGVEIPEDVQRVGWFRFGAGPGQGEGSTVIVGHRDGFDQGAGAFYSIASLDVADRVQLDLADGSTQEYEVVSREVIEKEILPTSEIFAEDGPERLTLISCIGYFDRSNGGYRENVVVTAVPVQDDATQVAS
jgi:LPXTG-site transpeptidase (sortase) family protein